MKKVLISILLIVGIVTGCDNMKNTPTSKVEDFLGKYQRMDMDVIEDLENAISKDNDMNEEQKKEYQSILEKQYQNLSYKIKKEEIVNDNATVEVEIEVLDYKTAVNNSKKYYQEHLEEFEQENRKNTEMNKNQKYIDYKISEMKKVNTKIKEDIIFQLTTQDGIWKLEELDKNDISKIHGLY